MSEKYAQLRLLPTVAEVRAARQAQHERANADRRCWQCRQMKRGTDLRACPDTGCEVCGTCEPTHAEFYDRWLARRLAQEEARG